MKVHLVRLKSLVTDASQWNIVFITIAITSVIITIIRFSIITITISTW